METYALPYVKQIASGNLLYDARSSNQHCDNLARWDQVEGGREVQREGTHVYLWLIPVVYGRNQHNNYKAIILQLKINKF